MKQVACFRSYDQQVAILEQIKIDDDESDEDFNQIKETINILLHDCEIQPQKIANKPTQIEECDNTENDSKKYLETELTKELEELKIQADFLKAKVNEKKKQIEQSKLENKKAEANFISKLRSFRNHFCKKAESLKSDS